MQATKQPQSPVTKKGLSNGSNNNNRSVAQRVMDMANSNSNSNIYHLTSPVIKSSSTSNSVASDLEVEDLTSRASKLDLSQMTKSESNANQPQNQQQQQQQVNLINDQNNNNSNSSRTCSVTSSINNDTLTGQSMLTYNSASAMTPQVSLVSSEAVIRQVVSTKKLTADELIQSPRGSSISGSRGSLKAAASQELARISLDTKVPLPSKTGNDFKAPEEEEEVSYYNNQATASLATLDELPPNGNTFETSNGGQSSFPKAGTKCRNAFKEAHNLSITVPTSCSQLHLNNNNNNNNVNNNNNNVHLTSREYLHQVVEDDYDTRYDNAMVENAMASFSDPKQNQSSTSSMSNPTSPKCKSAPTTPCNVTPTAFHQHTSHLNSMFVPRPANTLPLDIRKEISATCRVVPSSVGANSHAFGVDTIDDLMAKGELCMKNKDYIRAIDFLSQYIELTETNSNHEHQEHYKLLRAEAYLNLGRYSEAIEDSMSARNSNPIKAYLIQGKAQFLLGKHEDALAAFSFGLTQKPANKDLFEALVDAARKSRFKTNFEPKYMQLSRHGLENKPFVVVSVLGQEVLVEGYSKHAAIILESALKLESSQLPIIPSDDRKLRASVLSTVSYAYYVMESYEKAIAYMKKELDVEYENGEVLNQCKVLSNLGYTYYKMRKFDKSIEMHREQVKVAMHNRLLQQAAAALNAMGHVHMARNDLDSALTSHTNCLTLLRSLNNEFSQCKEILALGHIHAMKADYKLAEERYNEAYQLLRTSKTVTKAEQSVGYIMLYFNRAYLALKSRCFFQASDYYTSVIKLAQELDDPQRSLYKMRAHNGLGQTQRLNRKIGEAQQQFQLQLHYADQVGDWIGRSQALCNLGMTYQHMRDYHTAREFFIKNLELVKGNKLLSAYAYSYLGSMCFLEDCYDKAETYYEKSLSIFKELEYCTNERKTIELNIAAVSERMGHTEMNISTNTHQKKLIAA